MIKADYIAAVFLSISFACHQFAGRYQEAVSLCRFFTRVRDWINLSNLFNPAGCKRAKQQATTFMRIVALTVRRDLVTMVGC